MNASSSALRSSCRRCVSIATAAVPDSASTNARRAALGASLPGTNSASTPTAFALPVEQRHGDERTAPPRPQRAGERGDRADRAGVCGRDDRAAPGKRLARSAQRHRGRSALRLAHRPVSVPTTAAQPRRAPDSSSRYTTPPAAPTVCEVSCASRRSRRVEMPLGVERGGDVLEAADGVAHAVHRVGELIDLEHRRRLGGRAVEAEGADVVGLARERAERPRDQPRDPVGERQRDQQHGERGEQAADADGARVGEQARRAAWRARATAHRARTGSPAPPSSSRRRRLR